MTAPTARRRDPRSPHAPVPIRADSPSLIADRVRADVGRAARRATPTLAWDADTFSSASEAKLVSLTNQSRAAAGLRALKVDSTLTSIARWRSKDMIVRDYFSHTIPATGYNGLPRPRHEGLLLQDRRREHRLEQLPRRRRDRRTSTASS